MPIEATIASITIDPEPAQWGGLLRRMPLSERSTRVRRQLGLATDRPIIMSGHQAEFWHPGIVAKYFAMQAAAARLLMVPAWLVVDQDDHDPAPIRVPVRNGGDRLRAITWHCIDRAASVAKGVPAGTVPAREPEPLPKEVSEGHAATASVGAGLERLRTAMHEHAGERSLARQFTLASLGLLSKRCRGPEREASLLSALGLSRTDLFAWLVEQMMKDAARCTSAYNKAALTFPEAGIAPLRVAPSSGTSGVELPLWHIEPGNGESIAASRRRVTADSLRVIPRERLAPRALLMTAMLRMGVCDLFIHGTGGGAYDRVTDLWIKEWLGETLAASAVVTATMFLPLQRDGETGGVVGAPERAAEASNAAWLAHRARHDPALLGDDAAGREKARLVETIREEKHHGLDSRRTYRAMHALLERSRESHLQPLQALDAKAHEARALRASADLIGDRTWAFPLFDDADLVRLQARIDERFMDAYRRGD